MRSLLLVATIALLGVTVLPQAAADDDLGFCAGYLYPECMALFCVGYGGDNPDWGHYAVCTVEETADAILP